MSRAGLAIAGFLLTGCGPEAALWIRVEAPLSVPTQADALRLSAHRLSDGALVYQQTHDLAAAQIQFPAELALTTDNAQNLGTGAIEVQAEALLLGARAQPWATKTELADVLHNQLTHLLIQLCDCP